VTIKRYYRPELDVLRFIAFMLVFIVHRMDFIPIDPAQHYWLYNICLLGDFGVPVFFLLSAFLITELLFRESDETGKIQAKSFYIRRILRIWPLYFLVFFGLVLLERFLPYTGAQNPASWLAFTFFAGNWWICLHGWIPAYPVDPLWSISVEEQFYIAIPLIALFGRRLGVKTVSLFLIAFSYGLIVLYAMHPPIGFSSQWTNSFVQFQFFAAGTLLSIYLKGWVPKWRPALRLISVLSGLGCWLVASIAFGVQADTPHATVLQAPIGWALVLAGTTLLFLSMLGFPSKYLPAPIIYLGRISYGLYLFHELVYFLIFSPGKAWLTHLSQALHLAGWRGGLGTALAFCITVLVAHTSYQLYEKPFLRLKSRFTIVPSRDES
jgi:peptidoglycan/LPS O-acetylase OafA/YrhL